MRSTWIGLLALAGCMPEEARDTDGISAAPPTAQVAPTPEATRTRKAELRAMSDLFVHADGVALSHSGYAYVGMSGLTCGFTTEQAYMVTDTDYEDGGDEVEDSDDGDDDDQGEDEQNGNDNLLVRSQNGGLTQVDGVNRIERYTSGVVDARLLANDGMVARVDVGDGCRLDRWQAGEGRGHKASCDGEFTVDRQTGTVWLADGEAITSYDDLGTRRIDIEADQVVWDSQTGLLYTTLTGTDVVSAIDTRGVVQWTKTIPRNVIDIERIGDQSAVMALTDDGGVVVLEGATGATLGKVWIGTGSRLAAAQAGSTIAVVSQSQVSFLHVAFEPL